MMNRHQVIGYVGREPEVRYTAAGEPVASFSVATTERWKNKQGQQQERTEWFDCSAFGGLAGVVEKYVRKGALIYVDGPQHSSEFTDREGVKRRAWRIRVDTLKLLDRVKDAAKALADIPDDLPF